MERVEWTQFEQEIEDLRRAKYGHDHADIVPVETEEDQRHRQEFLAQNRLIKVKKTHQLVQKPIIEESKIMNNSCGKMDVICQFCGAIHFKGELASCKKFNICCSKGKLVFPPPKECPELLQMLFTNCHPKSANFIKGARKYNNALAFASMGASIDVPRGRGPYCFKIHGQTYHNATVVQYLDEEISVPPALKYA